jgi:hypothetical protein
VRKNQPLNIHLLRLQRLPGSLAARRPSKDALELAKRRDDLDRAQVSQPCIDFDFT